jgi:hypothetical protein
MDYLISKKRKKKETRRWINFNILLDTDRVGPGVWVAQARHNFSCLLIIKY